MHTTWAQDRAVDMPCEQVWSMDFRHILHPYAALGGQQLPIVRSAHGARLELEYGTPGSRRWVVDGMSSWWAAIHGYRHPVLDAAITEQLAQFSHVMFGGLTHQPAVQLTDLLVSILPKPLEVVFYCDSGSVAVEVAIKMALQYWIAQGKPHKNRLLTPQSGYHGDTFEAMSVSDPHNGMHSQWNNIVRQHIFAPMPPKDFSADLAADYLAAWEQIINSHHDEIAAVILEPIVQGAGGMRFYDWRYLAAIRELCDRFHILLICDEIATGFGRTGELFASGAAGISPDIMCLGKAMTGGYLSFAATITTRELADALAQAPFGAIFHGPTFMANPLACAVSYASIQLLLQSSWRDTIAGINAQLTAELAPAARFDHVVEVRTQGAIGVIELAKPVDVALATRIALEQGAWIRPFRNLIYAMPPYIISGAELSALTHAMVAAAQGQGGGARA